MLSTRAALPFLPARGSNGEASASRRAAGAPRCGVGVSNAALEVVRDQLDELPAGHLLVMAVCLIGGHELRSIRSLGVLWVAGAALHGRGLGGQRGLNSGVVGLEG